MRAESSKATSLLMQLVSHALWTYKPYPPDPWEINHVQNIPKIKGTVGLLDPDIPRLEVFLVSSDLGTDDT